MAKAVYARHSLSSAVTAMTVTYLDIFFGISGDMTLAALVDAGVDPDDLRAELDRLNLHGWDLTFERITEKGIGATRATVSAHHHGHSHEHDHNHGHEHGMKPGELTEIIDQSDLSQSVKERAKNIIGRVAQAEATVHRKPIDEIHFHELGGIDTVIDVVGAVIGFDLLGAEAIYASPIPLAHGFVDTAHGRLPVPVPAVVEVLKGTPTRPLDVEGETVTPTGAAIAVMLADEFGDPPPMVLRESGFGAGHRDFGDRANLLRILVGETNQDAADGDMQVLIETNIDDMNPELYAPARAAIFEAGAVDCWFQPVLMKKNRPAVTLSALAPPEARDRVARAILKHTTTFGVRMNGTERLCLEREIQTVETEYGMVQVKVGSLQGEVLTVAPEFDDCLRLAEETTATARDVYEAAAAAAHRLAESLREDQ